MVSALHVISKLAFKQDMSVCDGLPLEGVGSGPCDCSPLSGCFTFLFLLLAALWSGGNTFSAPAPTLVLFFRTLAGFCACGSWTCASLLLWRSLPCWVSLVSWLSNFPLTRLRCSSLFRLGFSLLRRWLDEPRLSVFRIFLARVVTCLFRQSRLSSSRHHSRGGYGFSSNVHVGISCPRGWSCRSGGTRRGRR